MRIAVYFTGHVRTAEYAIDNLLNYMGDLFPSIDIFLHTWKENNYKRLHHESRYFKQMLIDKNVDVPSDPLKLSREYFFPTTPPETFSVLEKLNAGYKKKIVSLEIEQANTKIGFLPKFGRKPSRFYSWYRANEMRKRYEELNEFKYDIIVKLRPDALFSTDSSLKTDIEYCLAHPENNNTMFSCNDIVFVALPSVMEIASNFMVDSDTIEYGHYLTSLNIKINKTPTRNWAIYRAESIPTSSLEFEYCRDHDQGWYFPIVRGIVKK
jgi:hypothetical protein